MVMNGVGGQLEASWGSHREILPHGPGLTQALTSVFQNMHRSLSRPLPRRSLTGSTQSSDTRSVATPTEWSLHAFYHPLDKSHIACVGMMLLFFLPSDLGVE